MGSGRETPRALAGAVLVDLAEPHVRVSFAL